MRHSGQCKCEEILVLSTTTPKQNGFIFSLRKVNRFPIRGLIWLNALQVWRKYTVRQFVQMMTAPKSSPYQVVEINSKFLLNFTWIGDLSNSLLEPTEETVKCLSVNKLVWIRYKTVIFHFNFLNFFSIYKYIHLALWPSCHWKGTENYYSTYLNQL